MRVCVVEDDPIMLDHVSAMLEDLGCQVAQAPSVEAAVDLINAFEPEAVVADILMPERDGLTLIMELRPRLNDIRVVAITSGGRVGADAVLSMAEGLGAHATLVKPFSKEDLKRALQIA